MQVTLPAAFEHLDVSAMCLGERLFLTLFVDRPPGYTMIQKSGVIAPGDRLHIGSMERPDHILVVDDDHDLRELLAQYLEKSGFRVTAVVDGRDMRRALTENRVDLIVLDVMLPREDGLTLCRNLRATDPESPPILMLTARGDEADRIVGLEMGADDYLSKPFASRELLARIRAILRRTRALPANLVHSEISPYLSFGEWQLDTTGRHLIDFGRHHGRVERRGISSAAGISGLSSTRAQPRPVAQPHPGQRNRILRPLDRPAGQSAPATAARRGPGAALYQDGAE